MAPAPACAKLGNSDDNEQVDWVIGVVPVNRATIEAKIADFPKAYLLIVNTPEECVIGGDRACAVQAFTKALACPFHELRGITTVHCEVAKPIHDKYRDFHLFPTEAPEGIQYYSGIRGGRYEINREACAGSIVGQAVEPFDYTKVIESAYADGVRVFVEMGPQASCARMISATLGDKDHAAIAACASEGDAITRLWQVLATCAVNGAPVSMAALPSTPVPTEDKRPRVSIPHGGSQVSLPPIPAAPATPATPPAPEPVQQAPIPEAPMPAPTPAPVAAAAPSTGMPQLDALIHLQQLEQSVQSQFLAVSDHNAALQVQALSLQQQLIGQGGILDAGAIAVSSCCGTSSAKHPALPRPQGQPGTVDANGDPIPHLESPSGEATLLDFDKCMHLAIGSIAEAYGPQFSQVDTYPTRVRLPDIPLQLVHRVMHVSGEHMHSGNMVTEHDILPGAWYLDNGNIPVSIAVESGRRTWSSVATWALMTLPKAKRSIACWTRKSPSMAICPVLAIPFATTFILMSFSAKGKPISSASILMPPSMASCT